MADFSIEQHIRNKGDSASDVENRFLNALIMKKKWDSDQIDTMSEEQFNDIENVFGNIIDRVGTPLESSIPEFLEGGKNRFFSEPESGPAPMSPVESFEESPDINRNIFQSPEQRIEGAPTPAQESEEAGFSQGLGGFGDLTSGRVTAALQEAMDKMQKTSGGLPDFDNFIDNFNTSMANQKAIEKEDASAVSPESFESGVGRGNLVKEVGIGTAGQLLGMKAAGKILPNVPKIGGTLNRFPTGFEKAAHKAGEVVTKGLEIGRKSAISATGAAAGTGLIVLSDEGSLDEVMEAAGTGAAIDVALQAAFPVAGGLFKLSRNVVGGIADRLRDQAIDLAFEAIKPWRRRLVREIENGGGSTAQIGRVIMDTNTIPSGFQLLKESIPFVPLGIKARIASNRKSIGKELGSLRDEVDDYADKMIDRLKAISFNDVPEEKKGDLLRNVATFSDNLRVDLRKAADRLRALADEVPLESKGSPSYTLAQKIRSKADDWDENAREALTVNEAVHLKNEFRPPEGTMGAPVLPLDVNFNVAVSAVLRDEIDQTVGRVLTYKKLIGENPNAGKIASDFTNNLIAIRDVEKEILKGGGIRNAHKRLRNTFAELNDKHQKLQMSYAVFSDAAHLIFEKQLATKANNMFSLRDVMAASAIFQASPGQSTVNKTFFSYAAAVTSKYLRNKGPTLGSRGFEFLANRAQNLKSDLSFGARTVDFLADLPGVSPAMYVALTSPDSPLQLHGFMMIDDQESLAEIKEGLYRDKRRSSIEKAAMINQINKQGYIKLFYGDRDDVAKDSDIETSKNLAGFRQDLDRKVPVFDKPLDVSSGAS